MKNEDNNLIDEKNDEIENLYNKISEKEKNLNQRKNLIDKKENILENENQKINEIKKEFMIDMELNEKIKKENKELQLKNIML